MRSYTTWYTSLSPARSPRWDRRLCIHLVACIHPILHPLPLVLPTVEPSFSVPPRKGTSLYALSGSRTCRLYPLGSSLASGGMRPYARSLCESRILVKP